MAKKKTVKKKATAKVEPTVKKTAKKKVVAKKAKIVIKAIAKKSDGIFKGFKGIKIVKGGEVETYFDENGREIGHIYENNLQHMMASPLKTVPHPFVLPVKGKHTPHPFHHPLEEPTLHPFVGDLNEFGKNKVKKIKKVAKGKKGKEGK